MLFQIPKSMEALARPHLSLVEQKLLSIRPPHWFKGYILNPILFHHLPSMLYKTTAFEKYVRDESKCVDIEQAETAVCHTVLNQSELDDILKACR